MSQVEPVAISNAVQAHSELRQLAGAQSDLSCIEAEFSIAGQRILAPVSAQLMPGRITALMGPNGAGKSTLLALLAGQRQASRGQVLLDGQMLLSYPTTVLAQRRALLPQTDTVVFDFTVRDIAALGRYPHRFQPAPDEALIVEQALALTGVDDLAERVFNTLSGGEKARAHLARTLAQLWHPLASGADRWLLLDEPTAALDLAHQHAVMRLLRAWAGQGTGVVLVLHDLNLARRYADDVLILTAKGGVHHGTTAQVLTPALIEQVWHTPCQPVSSTDGVTQYLFGSPQA